MHLFIDIIHDCCSHMIPLLHLSKLTQKILIHNCNAACYPFHSIPSEKTPTVFRWYLLGLKYPIFHVEILCKYTLRKTILCVWISVKMSICTFDVISKTLVFSIEIPGPALHLIPILPTLMWSVHQFTLISAIFR